ncbi:hypothetical protein BKA62DRAFT_770669 [Auriculariales sp. MPI-PUGE-AT-0066]|nr:hypothetical protein BKA62DRAFT_770669 [Auriculariales sp. MPI-PUGE-AT-0066]
MLTTTSFNASAMQAWGDDDDDESPERPFSTATGYGQSGPPLTGSAVYAASAQLTPTPKARSDPSSRHHSKTPGSPTRSAATRAQAEAQAVKAGPATVSRLPKFGRAPSKESLKPPATVSRMPTRATSAIPMPKSTIRKRLDSNNSDVTRPALHQESPIKVTMLHTGFDSSDEEDQVRRSPPPNSRLPEPKSKLRMPGQVPVSHKRTASTTSSLQLPRSLLHHHLDRLHDSSKQYQSLDQATASARRTGASTNDHTCAIASDPRRRRYPATSSAAWTPHVSNPTSRFKTVGPESPAEQYQPAPASTRRTPRAVSRPTSPEPMEVEEPVEMPPAPSRRASRVSATPRAAQAQLPPSGRKSKSRSPVKRVVVSQVPQIDEQEELLLQRQSRFTVNEPQSRRPSVAPHQLDQPLSRRQSRAQPADIPPPPSPQLPQQHIERVDFSRPSHVVRRSSVTQRHSLAPVPEPKQQHERIREELRRDPTPEDLQPRAFRAGRVPVEPVQQQTDEEMEEAYPANISHHLRSPSVELPVEASSRRASVLKAKAQRVLVNREEIDEAPADRRSVSITEVDEAGPVSRRVSTASFAATASRRVSTVSSVGGRRSVSLTEVDEDEFEHSMPGSFTEDRSYISQRVSPPPPASRRASAAQHQSVRESRQRSPSPVPGPSPPSLPSVPYDSSRSFGRGTSSTGPTVTRVTPAPARRTPVDELDEGLSRAIGLPDASSTVRKEAPSSRRVVSSREELYEDIEQSFAIAPGGDDLPPSRSAEDVNMLQESLSQSIGPPAASSTMRHSAAESRPVSRDDETLRTDIPAPARRPSAAVNERSMMAVDDEEEYYVENIRELAPQQPANQSARATTSGERSPVRSQRLPQRQPSVTRDVPRHVSPVRARPAAAARPQAAVEREASPARGRRPTRNWGRQREPSPQQFQQEPEVDEARARSRSRAAATYAAVQEARVDDMFARRMRDSSKHRGLDLSQHSTTQFSRPDSAMDFNYSRSRANSFMSQRSQPQSRAVSVEVRGRHPSPVRTFAPAPVPALQRSVSAGPDDISFRAKQPESRAVSREPSVPRSGGFAAPTAAIQPARNREPSRTRPPPSRDARPQQHERKDPLPLQERDMNKNESRLTQPTAASRGKTRESSKPPSTREEKPKRAVTERQAASRPVERSNNLTRPTKASQNRTADPAKDQPNLPPSEFQRSIDGSSKAAAARTRKFLKDAITEASAEMKGDGLGDVIAKYGERLLTWITNPVPATTQALPQKERKRKAKEDHGYRSRDQRPEDDGDDESDHEQHRSSALEDLSPRKRREAGIIIPLSSPTTMSPMRRAAKRSSDSNSTEDEPTYKRARTTAPLSSPTQSSAHPRSSSPPPVRPASRSGHTNATRARSRMGATGYATKQRVLEKLEAERIRKELEAQARRDRPETFVPEYLPAPKPAQRTITPTVTQPFTFQSDARAARPRHDEFDSRRQLWEDRIELAGPLTSSRSSSRAGLSAPSSRAEINVPDFAAIHASNAAALASKRPKINPTVPALAL